MIRVAIVGAGLMGEVHAGNFARLRGHARVVCVCDRDAARAAVVASAVDAEPVAELEAAVARDDVDAVAICLPTHLHREATELALAAGKHVFLEKPIALTAADADAVVAAARAGDRILMVGLVLRFWPGYAAVHRLATGGELGRPLSVSASRLQPPLDWGDWTADAARAGSVAVETLVHDADQMNWLLGRPRRVFARAVGTGAATPSGHVVAIVEYDGALGTAETSAAMPSSFAFASTIRVRCERGAVEYSFGAGGGDAGSRYGAADLERLTLYRDGAAAPERLPLAPLGERLWQAEVDEFVACVETGRQPVLGTAEQAREALAVSLAVDRSIASGRIEAVPS